ncbi:hypothetical protein TWF481_005171 [Arthrobotrys musiformis]|uniref:Uncharacterized protein n=1 Tax=Arthrobotrys musiformis TaxID=47236 RepID=A0AAV9WCZ3_9PEZI
MALSIPVAIKHMQCMYDPYAWKREDRTCLPLSPFSIPNTPVTALRPLPTYCTITYKKPKVNQQRRTVRHPVIFAGIRPFDQWVGKTISKKAFGLANWLFEKEMYVPFTL